MRIRYVSIHEVISGDMLALNEPEDEQPYLVLEIGYHQPELIEDYPEDSLETQWYISAICDRGIIQEWTSEEFGGVLNVAKIFI